MTREQIVAMSTAYFAAVDAMDVQSLRDLLTPDCVFIIESHGITYDGRDAIVGLFTTRWKNPVVTSKHGGFAHVADTQTYSVASTFTARYFGPNAPEPKSNANVFSLRDDRIAKIQVYMSGENTVRA